MNPSDSINLRFDHKLKILPEYYYAVEDGRKTFEIRKNDRGFHLGQTVLLQKHSESRYTGDNILVEITYMTDYEKKDGYVVFGFRKLFEIPGKFNDEEEQSDE